MCKVDMPARPPVIKPQTSRQAKAAYKKHGPRLSEREMRQLERGAELDERAERIKEQEQRKRAAKKRREEKERKEREIRRQLGVGLATQMIGYSHSQAKMKSGMEAFVGLKKRKSEEAEDPKEQEIQKKLESLHESLEKELEEEKEPWDEDEVDLGAVPEPVPDTPQPSCAEEADQWSDDDLDDASLLQAHDLAMSDVGEDWSGSAFTPSPAVVPPTPPLALSKPLASARPLVLPPAPRSVPSDAAPVSVLSSKPRDPKRSTSPPSMPTRVAPTMTRSPKPLEPGKPASSREDSAFTCAHGPINPAIEKILDTLPDPLIEICSLDTPDISTWNPPPSFLHRLNPIGVPLHRLRIKRGCTAVLLRDLETGSQLSKDTHLRIVGLQKQGLECTVLDGPLRCTNTILKKSSFPARYRNDDKCPYKRLQFPIRVVSNTSPTMPPTNIVTAPAPAPAEKSRRSSGPLACLIEAITKTSAPPVQTPPQAQFKMPGLPASRAAKLQSASNPPPPPPSATLDCWDDFDFLASSTQLARELSEDPSPAACIQQSKLENQSQTTNQSRKPLKTPQPSVQPPMAHPKTRVANATDFTLDELDELRNLPQSTVSDKTDGQQASNAAPPSNTGYNMTRSTPPPAAPHDPQNPAPRSGLKRNSSSSEANTRLVKRIALQGGNSGAEWRNGVGRHGFRSAGMTMPSAAPQEVRGFSEFGISTQDVVALVEDDDEFC